MAAVKCSVRKARFFRCPGRLLNRTRAARALRGFQHHKGEHLLCFLFSDPMYVGLRNLVPNVPADIVPILEQQVKEKAYVLIY